MLPCAMGVGVAMVILSLMVAIYYNVIMAYCLHYLFNSMRYTGQPDRKKIVKNNCMSQGRSCLGVPAPLPGEPTRDATSEEPTSRRIRWNLILFAIGSLKVHVSSLVQQIEGFCVVDSVGGCVEQRPQTSEVAIT